MQVSLGNRQSWDQTKTDRAGTSASVTGKQTGLKRQTRAGTSASVTGKQTGLGNKETNRQGWDQ